MTRLFLIFAAANGFLSVALGAFAALGPKAKVSAYNLEVLNTASEYQMTHSLALLGVSILLMQKTTAISLTVSAWAFSLGLIVFPGSLYLLVLLNMPVFGAITPLGGAAFLVGWAAMLVYGIKSQSHGNKA